MIPGIKIFLDVDDLKDIGSLEDYVDRTQVMLFFLSKGYFRSKALPQPLPFRECLAVSPTTTRALLACRTACARFRRRSRRASRSSSCKRRTRPRAAGRCRRSPPDPCSMTLRGLLSPHTALRGGVAAAAAHQHTHSRTPSLHDCRSCEHSARRASSRRSLTGGGRRRRGTASTSISVSRLRSSPRCRHGQLPAAVLPSPRP